jgi:hypothetical protein
VEEYVRRAGQSERAAWKDLPPPNLDDFTTPLTEQGQQHVHASIWNPGASTWVVSLVYGPDDHEVQTVRDQLQAAGIEIFKCGAAEGLPEDFA